ncbi:MAG: threonine ammonia-lyase [Actinobacteria bacterium]|nr:threonine ammonia-lyase [Actinomycetota bacterium]
MSCAIWTGANSPSSRSCRTPPEELVREAREVLSRGEEPPWGRRVTATARNSCHDEPVALPVTLADVQAAADTIAGSVIVTPTSPARTFSEITGANLWVKFENLQFTGSFKERGARNFLAHLLPDERAHGVVAASAGNHAQGVAYHAQLLGIPATIVMPTGTPFTKVANTAHHGAHIMLEGDGYEAALAHAQAVAAGTGAHLVPGFDHRLIIAGQGTVAIEVLAAAPTLDTIVVPVGGGGLISGIAVVVKAMRPEVRVVGVQSAGYPGMLHVLGRGPAPSDGPTIAEGIAVVEPGQLTREIVGALVDEIVTVTEERIEEATALFVEIEKSVVEGAGATALAAVLQHGELFRGRNVALIASGGNIDPRVLTSVLMRALARSGRLIRLHIEVPDRPGALAAITTVVAAKQGNVVDVQHRRDLPGLALTRARLDLSVETRDRAHADEIVQAVTAAGFQVEMA